MTNKRRYLFRDREDAFNKLAPSFGGYDLQNCCVIAMSNDALPIAIPLARKLRCDLTFIPSLRIEDPGDSSRSIGVVSFYYAIVENVARDIPQDFLYRNVRRLRSELLSRYPGIYNPTPFDFHNKTVIVVDDVIQTSAEILNLLKVIRRQQPEQIVVASPAITHSAAQIIVKNADATTFIHIADEDTVQRTYLNSSSITDEKVVELLAVPTRPKRESKLPIEPKFKIDTVGMNKSTSIGNPRSRVSCKQSIC